MGVDFLGDRDDVTELLHAVDVVAMPSRWEGMSISMLEAMAAAKPVVATGVAGVAETVGRGGGAVVAVDDPPALARAIIDRLVDPDRAANEGRAGREIVRARHRPVHALESFVDLYEDLVGQLNP